jgi:hypothetical protein
LKTLKEILILAIVLVFFTVIAIRAQQGSTQLPSYPIGVHISTTSATVVKGTPGTLHTITFGTDGASAVVTVYDIAAAGCTGTPASGAQLIITLPASGGLPGSLLLDKQFTYGICIQSATAASDINATAF